MVGPVQELIARLRDIEVTAPDVDLVVLFGSAASGRARPGSDVDVAVRCTGPGDLDALYRLLAPRIGSDRLDLVDLHRAGPVLMMAVARAGRLLFERRPGLYRQFQALASRRFCDTAKLRHAQRRAIHVFLERELTTSSPVDAAIVRAKLGHIMTSLDLLRPMRALSLEDYRARVWERKGIERVLQEAIEAALDINAHIVAERGLEVPDDYYGGCIKLGELGILSRDLAHALAPSAGLRNRLVHEYDEIDDAKVLAAVATILELYPRYIAAIEAELTRLGL